MKRIITTASLILLSFSAQAYVIGGASQALTSSSGAWNWENGAYLTDFKSALENPAFFGAGGVVEESLTLTTLTTIDSTTLSTLDMFIAPWVSDGQGAVFGTEVRDFFLGGGDLFLLQDDSSHDILGDLLGISTTASTGSVSNGGAPFFDGAFGTATDVTQHYAVGQLDSSAITAKNGTAVGTNVDGQVTSAYWEPGQYAVGAGALFVIADVDMIASTPPNGAIYGPTLSDLNDNAVYALNTFSFIQGGGVVDVPEPSIIWLLGSGLALIGFARRKS